MVSVPSNPDPTPIASASPSATSAEAPAPSASAAATLQPNAATEGTMRLCGPASTPVLTLATLGVSLAMGTAVALVLTKRIDVARWAGFANVGLAALVLLFASRSGMAATCMPIGMMAASLPFFVGVASFALAARRKISGPRPDSG
jgi:hypothetical protein